MYLGCIMVLGVGMEGVRLLPLKGTQASSPAVGRAPYYKTSARTCGWRGHGPAFLAGWLQQNGKGVGLVLVTLSKAGQPLPHRGGCDSGWQLAHDEPRTPRSGRAEAPCRNAESHSYPMLRLTCGP